MHIQDRIDQLESRAERINTTLFMVAKAAGVDYSAIQRWRKPDANPTMRILNRDLPKLETAFAEAEIEILKHVVALHPDAARAVLAGEEPSSQFEAAE